MVLLQNLFATVLSTIWDVLPIAVIVIGFQLYVIRRPPPNPKRLGIGFVYVLLGLALFLAGLEKALFPLGELLAHQLTDLALESASASGPSAGRCTVASPM